MSTRDTCPYCAAEPPEQELFAREVFDRSDEIDPDSEADWASLTTGWALAKGMSPHDANTFAWHIRYHTDLG